MKRRDAFVGLAAIMIMLFLYTAISKLLDIEEFRRQLSNQELPSWSKDTLLWLIPGSEMLVSLLLAISSTRLKGFYGAAVLMFFFTGYMGLVVIGFFDRVPCSCGGVLKGMDFGTHLLFNAFFLALAVLGIVLFHSQNKSAVTKDSNQN